MMRTIYKSLAEVPERILEAYHSGKWSCHAPPVCTTLWDTLAWVNFIGTPELERVARKLPRSAIDNVTDR